MNYGVLLAVSQSAIGFPTQTFFEDMCLHFYSKGIVCGELK